MIKSGSSGGVEHYIKVYKDVIRKGKVVTSLYSEHLAFVITILFSFSLIFIPECN